MARPEIRRQLLSTSSLGAGVLLVAALVGFANYFGAKYYHRFDWTRDEIYSLSEKSLGVLDGLDRDVEVVIFMRPESQLYGPVRELLARYEARTPRVRVRAVDPVKNLVAAQQLVDKYQVRNLNVVVFDSGDDRRVIEEADLAEYDYSGLQFGAAPELTGFRGEERFTGALLELAEARKPRILFTTGHGELSLDDYSARGLSSAQELLGRENLDMQPWATLGASEVPAGTDLVVIAGPTSGFVAPELALLSKYLDAGGRLLLLLDPALGERDGLIDLGLTDWLAGYGVRLGARMDSAAVRAWCSLSVLPQTAPAVLRTLGAMPEVEEVSAVSGQFDYLVFLRCPSHERLDALLDQIGQMDGVHRTQTSIVLSRKIDRRSVVA